MPTYCFCCEDCGSSFEIVARMSEIGSAKCECLCGSTNVYRDFFSEGVNLFEGVKTLGSVADRNTDTFSSDFKEMQAEKNKAERSQTSVLDKYGLKKYEA